MKKSTKQPMTIEGLAERMDRGFIQMQEYFDRRIDQKLDEKLSIFALSVAKGFAEADKKFEEMNNRMDRMEAQFSVVRRDILGLYDKFPSNYAFDQLSQRVSVLEDKTGKKRK